MDPRSADREKKLVALSSVIAAVFITGFKLTIGLMTNSLGILSEAAHSGLDLLAAAMTLFAVSYASRPPDKEHQYGHGKIENVSAFVETLILVFTCVWIISEAISRLVSGTSHVESSFWGYVVIVSSIVIDFSRSRALKKAAIKHKSQALEADALHFSSDIWSSLVVLGGLVAVNLGYQIIDPIAALIVAILVMFVSYRLGRRTIDALMDRVPHGMYDDIRALIERVEGVEEIRSLRIRPSGSKVFVDTTVAIARTLHFQSAHDIMDAVEKEIHEHHTNMDVVVHAEPVAGRDETVGDRVRMLVVARGLRDPHNLEVHLHGGKYHVDFDMEFRKGKEFIEAHNIATEVEREIQKEIAGVEKVTIHLEEYLPTESVTDASDGDEQLLSSEIEGLLNRESRVLGYSDLTLLKVNKTYTLSMNCVFEKSQSLGEIHQVICELETKLYDRFKSIRRVTIHAEPN